MQKNKRIMFFFFIMFVLMLYFNTTVYANSVFGENISETTSTNTNQNSIIEGAKQSGKTASTKMAQFKNAEILNEKLDELFKFLRWTIATVTTFGAITSFLVFSVSFFKLATAPSHPIERRKVMIDILQSGIATVLLGGLSLIMTVFYKTFSTFINNAIFLTTDYKTAFAMALIDYKYLICGIMGVLALSMFIVFIKDVIALASSGGNPQQRAQAMKGLLTTGIAVVGFGGTGMFVAIFNGLL